MVCKFSGAVFRCGFGAQGRPLGGAHFSRLPSRLDPITFFSIGSCQSQSLFSRIPLSLRRSRTTCIWSRATGLCLAAAWAQRFESSSQAGVVFRTPRLGLPPRLAALPGRILPWGHEHRDTSLPVSGFLCCVALGLMPSERHVPLQPLNSVRISLHEVWW